MEEAGYNCTRSPGSIAVISRRRPLIAVYPDYEMQHLRVATAMEYINPYIGEVHIRETKKIFMVGCS